MGISDKLVKLNTIKVQIKGILSDNAIEVDNIFETYPDKIRFLVGGLSSSNQTLRTQVTNLSSDNMSLSSIIEDLSARIDELENRNIQVINDGDIQTIQ